MILVRKLNSVYIKLLCENDIAQELSSYFTFAVPNAKYSPAFKNKMWDGKIRLFNIRNRQLYGGLLYQVKEFAKERDYEIHFDEGFDDVNISLSEAEEYIKSIKSLTLEPRDYQVQAFVHALRKRRALLLSPTASGKSLIIYLLSRFYHKLTGKRILIVVHNTSLVYQMASDFVSYGCDEKYVHKIYDGKEPNSPFVITTWQSVYKLGEKWFDQYGCVIGDEAHLFKANSLKDIMCKLVNCPYRFGFTGTLDGTATHKMVLEGLFGEVKKVTTTAELIEQKHLSQFKIKGIVLKYDEDTKRKYSKVDYQTEIDFITNNTQRIKFIVNLARSLKGNTLILFRLIDHGKELVNYFNQVKHEKNIFYVDGDVDGMLREGIRDNIEKINNGVIVASLGTFSTGVNIKNLHNIVFAAPSKSRVKTLQSIGRGLRLSQNKELATLYDIADDISWKSKKNHTLNHFIERVQMYDEEKFEYKIYNVEIGA